MAIFQKSIVNKYLKNLDNEKVTAAHQLFKTFYGSKLRLHNIINLKEENYQEGFLREIFVQVLGYTINPDLNYNLTTEYKNQNDSKKADGAILRNNSAIGVIELKSTKTQNLETIKNQAFNYKHNQPDCRYVITSNFQNLRFYIDNSIDYEEFNLFELAENLTNFKIFYLILSQESIFKDVALEMKEETKFHEESITDKFYRDYKLFKDAIFDNLIKNNPQYDKLTLFKKSQKLLDRFLFVYFAEDSGLCPPNSVDKIIEQWKRLNEDDVACSLYSRFQKLFQYLDKGYVGKHFEFPAYNGGLFRADELLDHEKTMVDDSILLKHCPILSNYDFNTEIDVNILGHIFEHSLNEIEEITAELKGEVVEKSKTKRKKDGIFYTPEYITNYIIENTIGKLCTEKQTELGLNPAGFENPQDFGNLKDKKGKLNKDGKLFFEQLQSYKEWLFTLKILDPACGSGAFLNAALGFLIREHQQIDDVCSDLTGEKIRLFDTDKTILEKNIFGVDINDESVEIAKLSLWLRTAKKDRKLSDLNDNIKCGNSLIDNPEIAGEKAFDWNTEFPDIMQNGGFDVVIGNPPYGANLQDIEKYFFRKKHKELQFKIDTYSIFILQSLNIVKNLGYVYYIIPNTFLDNYFEEKVRQKLLFENTLTEIVDLNDKVFDDAVVHSMIIGFRKSLSENHFVRIKTSKNISSESDLIPIDYFKTQDKFVFSIRNYHVKDFLSKLSINSERLKDIVDIRQAIKTGNDDYYLSKNKEQDNFKPIIGGKHIRKWAILKSDLFVNYGEHLACPRNYKIFEQPKILIRETGNTIIATYDDENYYILSSLYNAILINPKYDLKYILTLINSKLFQYQLKLIAFDKTEGAFTKARIFHYYELPIKSISLEIQQPFIAKAELMLSLNKESQSKVEKFIKRLHSNFSNLHITNKLASFYEYDFHSFVSELKKQKISMNLKQQDEWEEYFESYSSEIKVLQQKIAQTDREIDKMVYELYELTPEEIAIVENVK